MAGQYPDRIKTLPLYDGRFDAYRLAADGADVLFAGATHSARFETDTDEIEFWFRCAQGFNQSDK